MADREVSIRPGNAYLDSLYIAGVARDSDLLVRVLDSAGRELIRYRPEERRETELPEPASEPAPPENMASADELYITGLHLEQYRHATRHPEFYWIEALRRDPSDARCNNAMGLPLLRRGEAAAAEKHFQKAIARLTRRNPNPYDGEPYYHLGLALKAQGRVDEAYAVFYKAVWTYAWKSAANYELALLDCRRSDFGLALEHLMESLAVDSGHLKARDLKTAILRKLERRDEAQAVARDTLRMDRLDFWANHEMDLIEGSLTAPGVMRGEPQNFLDLAYDYADAGFWQEAIEILLACPKVHPMVFYSLGHWAEQSDDARAAERYRHLGLEVPPDYCFPARLDELRVLESALAANPRDARAHYYLGNLLYDKGRREEAIEHWDKACEAAPGFSIPWRNLGIAYFNVRRDALRALACYERARAAAPADARLLYEYDQLRKRMGASPSERLAELERSHSLLEQHDGLTIELVSLYNQTGNPERALSILVSRRFHPWEGGEGLASEQYVLSRILLGREALDRGDAGTALEHFEAARVYPHSLGEGKPLLIEEGHVDYFAGQALSSLGNETEAHRCWERAAAPANGFNLFTYFRALASRKLGRENEAQKLLSDLRAFAELQLKAEVKVDYFATSLPNFLLFEDDLQKCKQVECLFLRGRANQGSGRTAAAAEDYRQVLELDRSHFWAEEALRELDVGWEQDVARA